MQSFAKAATAAKVKKPEAKPVEPDPMSEDEEDDSEVLPKPKVHDGPGRKSKREREEELRKMMEEDDDEVEEKSEQEEEEEANSPAEEPVDEEMVPEPTKEEPSEVVASSGDGRRRGKRRIMKKKQILDDQGYLGQSQQMLSARNYRANRYSQSQYKSPDGNPSLRTRHLHLLQGSQSRPVQPLHPRLQNQRRPHPREAKEISCPSSPRNETPPGLLLISWLLWMNSIAGLL